MILDHHFLVVERIGLDPTTTPFYLPAANKAENATIQFGEANGVNGNWIIVATAWIKDPVVIANPATNNSPDTCVVQVRARRFLVFDPRRIKFRS